VGLEDLVSAFVAQGLFWLTISAFDRCNLLAFIGGSKSEANMENLTKQRHFGRRLGL